MKKLAAIYQIVVCLSLLITSAAYGAEATTLKQATWSQILTQAKGQTVYFNAWGGSQEINDYLLWANKQLEQQYDVTLKQVKVTDIAETTQRLLAEKSANKNRHGSVDMVWINGENFASMKKYDLLYGPFTQQLPNWQMVNQALPVTTDFTQATEGLEAPWGVGQLVFIYDKQTLAKPPKSFAELLTFAQAHPGKISYPKPPEFHGISFLKAALLELTANNSVLYHPIKLPEQQALFDTTTAPLWHYLDKLNKVAWHQGKQFPSSAAQTIQLLDDGQLLLALTFNPNAALAAIEQGNLTESAATYAFNAGALTNIHFLAIPWNANAKAGALVAINFLMSPAAQVRKADTTLWGDPTILKANAFNNMSHHQHFNLYPSQAEPDPSWGNAIAQAWFARYNH